MRHWAEAFLWVGIVTVSMWGCVQCNKEQHKVTIGNDCSDRDSLLKELGKMEEYYYPPAKE